MSVEMNRGLNERLTPLQEIKLAKPVTDLYIGQVLKTIVVTRLANDEVTININGQHLNAKTPYQFMPGDMLRLKVIVNSPEETILEVQRQSNSQSLLQSALLNNLPIQAPATSLLNHLNQLSNFQNLPNGLLQHIRLMLSTLTPLAQLPKHMTQAIIRSGVFLEAKLLKNSLKLRNDFKGQNLKLLNYLYTKDNYQGNQLQQPSNVIAKDILPLPGAIPQPLTPESILDLANLSPEEIQSLLKHQVTQVLARITSSQLNYLSNDQQHYMLMLDLPIKTNAGVDVIPILIKEHKAEPLQLAKWSFSFALHLSQLGDLQATVSITGRQLDVSINANDSATLETLQSYEKEFNKQVSELGLNLNGWHLHHGLEDNHIDTSSIRLLDINI